MGSESRPYRTIKALVFDYVHQVGGSVDYDALTKLVLEHFPSSRWKRTHWAWYRHQICSGRFRKEFSAEERRSLGRGRAGNERGQPPAASSPEIDTEVAPPSKGPQAKDPEVKRLGDKVLDHARFVIDLAAGDNPDLRLKLNRWVFARLMQDEIRAKRPIKHGLWDAGIRACQACGQKFSALKGVELHRKDGNKGYSAENCELLCRECHQELPGR